MPLLKTPTPLQILQPLLPTLRLAAHYAREIQPKIQALPDKVDVNNHFAEALTDADLAVQNLVEVALLANFPQIRFFGEEWEKSGNTKFFRATTLGESGDYLVTLDPIDGTRFYLDGHDNYQIILSVLNHDDYEAAIALSPSQDKYYYAVRGIGAFVGNLSDEIKACQPLLIKQNPASSLFLGWGLSCLKPKLSEKYNIIDVTSDYSHTEQVSNVNGLLTHDLAGAVIAYGNFIDGAALAFIAQEIGYLVTDFKGQSLPPVSESNNNQRPGIIIAATDTIQQDIMSSLKSEAVAMK